jgi:parallel beta-helix repeat protein
MKNMLIVPIISTVFIANLALAAECTPTTTTTTTPTTTTPTTTTTTTTPLICAKSPTSSLVVNVKDKGAKGNGSNNDTAAIQAAINQVANSGGTVLIPDGVYMIDAITSLYPKSNMTLSLTSGAVLKAIPNNSENYDIIRIQGVSNVNVIGGTVEGERDKHNGTTGEWGMGIGIYGASNVVIEGVTAKNGWGDGFYISKNSSNITACSITADNNRRQGLTITSVNGAVIKNSIFKNTNGTYPSAGLNIEPNSGETANNVQVLNSQFNNNLLFGIQISSPSSTASVTNVTIDGNTVNNNGVVGKYSAGIKLSHQKSLKVSNNMVKDNVQDGIILVNGSSNNSVTGNIITRSGYGNTVDKNIGIGILLENTGTTANSVINNVATGNKQGILDLVGGNTIKPNTIN